MSMPMKRWPRGTGQWNRSRVVIVAADPARRDRLLEHWAVDHDVVVVKSPLEVIRRCEADGPSITTVVLSDIVGSVCQAELAEFLREQYPYVRVMVETTSRTSHEHEYSLEARA